MKLKITAIVVGTMLAVSNVIPATATVSKANGQAKNNTGTKVSTQKTKPHHNKSHPSFKKPVPANLPKLNAQAKNSAVVNTSKTATWRLDKSSAKFYTLTQVEQQNFDKFQNAINQGLSPVYAAQRVEDAKYAKVKGTSNQYQIHLSPEARVTFLVNDKDHVVQILQVGGKA